MNKLFSFYQWIFPQNTDENICSSAHPVLSNDVIVSAIFNTLILQKNCSSIAAFASVDKHTHEIAQYSFKQNDLIEFCGSSLNIIDAKMMGIEIDDEPDLNPFLVFKSVYTIAPHIKDEGVTLLTMPKGLTFQQLQQVAEAEGMVVDDVIDSNGTHALEDQDELPIKETYRILISNNVLTNSLNKSFSSQQKLAREIGCTAPSILEYFALSVYSYKIFKKYFYENISARSTTYQIYSDGTCFTSCGLPGPYLNFGQFYSPGNIKIDHFGFSYCSDPGIGMGIKKMLV